MEKMDNTISAVVPLLLQSKSSSKSINFGPIAAALFTCIRACHEAKNIFRDVKSDNFMLTIDAAAATAKAKAGSTTLENELASRIRLIDLAIATQWTPMYYETDEADFNGTPLYASLNVHSGKKASFRDDLEAVGYVLAELIIQLNSGDPSKKLPWSHGKSDRDIGSIKKSLVEDKNSDFYAQLGNASRLFSEYLDIIRGYSFKEAPDYDELAKILSKITLPRTTATKSRRAATKKTAQAKKTAPTKRKTPSKVARRSTAKKTETEDDEDHYTGDPDQSFDDSVYADAHETVEDMEWEYIVDENEKPKEDSKPSARSDRALRRQRFNADKQHVGKVEEIIVIDDDGDDDDDDESSESNSGIGLKRRGVRLLVTKGPHKGDSYDLEAGANEIVLIGSNPTSKIGAVLSLKKDKTLNTTHVRLDLAITRKCTAVKVTARSNAKTLVNNNAVNSTKAFINDNIVIGGTTLSVQTL
jgi:serine/threonine protein kinase